MAWCTAVVNFLKCITGATSDSKYKDAIRRAYPPDFSVRRVTTRADPASHTATSYRQRKLINVHSRLTEMARQKVKHDSGERAEANVARGG